MTDCELTLKDYEALSEKLREFREGLNDRERRVLEAVFLAARIHVSLHSPHDAAIDTKAVSNSELTLASVQQQILDAFIPGEGTDLMVYRRIGGDPTS